MNTITIDLDSLTAEEQETVKRLAKKKKPYWVPKEGETYYNVSGYGCIAKTRNEEFDGDDFAISIGNCFHTVEEAEEAVIKLKMQTKWKRLSLEAGEADNPWDGKQKHWFVEYECEVKELCCNNSSSYEFGIVYFPTNKSIRDAIAELGEDNVKKYILGVEE